MARTTSLQLDAGTTLADVVRFARTQAWPATDPAHADDLQLLLEELLSNLVRHAFAAHATPRGACEVSIDGGGARIELRDNGPPFNPFDTANPPGYGLRLVRALASGCGYQRETGENRVRVRLDLFEAPG